VRNPLPHEPRNSRQILYARTHIGMFHLRSCVVAARALVAGLACNLPSSFKDRRVKQIDLRSKIHYKTVMQFGANLRVHRTVEPTTDQLSQKRGLAHP